MNIEFHLFGRDAIVCSDGASLPQLLAVWVRNCAKRQPPAKDQTVFVVKGRRDGFARYFSASPVPPAGKDEPPEGEPPSYGIINGDGSLDDDDSYG